MGTLIAVAMKSALLLAGCVVLACFISTEALNKDETIMKAYLADQAEHKTEEMVEAPPPVDNHVYTKFPSLTPSRRRTRPTSRPLRRTPGIILPSLAVSKAHRRL